MSEAYAQFPALPQLLGILDTYATKTVFPSITLLLDYLSKICMIRFLSPPVPMHSGLICVTLHLSVCQSACLSD